MAMVKQGGGEEHLFLGDPQWESLLGGRVRCVQTGHEMPLAAQPAYASTKKCRSALFDAALKKRTPPFNFFDQSPVAKDKIICKLTGVVLNKKEDAVWKHMLGKKFEQKLAEKEAEKEIARKDVEMSENSSEKQSSKGAVETSIAGGEDMARRTNKGNALATLENVGIKEAEEEANSDDSDFWVPPVGARWDFDVGSNDRWSVPSHNDPEQNSQSIRIDEQSAAAALENRSKFDNGDTEMLYGEEAVHDSGSSDESECNIITKRALTASAPRSQKKRAKRLKKADSNNQTGV